jgi:hypothetical protein
MSAYSMTGRMNERYILIKTLRLTWCFSIRRIFSLSHAFSYIFLHIPNYVSDLVQPYAENVHNNNLSQQISNENLRLPYCNTVSYNKSCLPSTISLWNELPASTKTCPSVEAHTQILHII